MRNVFANSVGNVSVIIIYHCRDAWNSLGDMNADQAMSLYVDELKKVTISCNFCLQTLETFYTLL